MALIDRLRLSKDLATAGLPGLDPKAADAAALQGVVQVDLAFDIAARAALDHLGRPIPLTTFPELLAALPELGAHLPAMEDLHRVRNNAQHGGLVPAAAIRQQLASDAAKGLEIAFAMAGSDFHRFSSVPQIQSSHFRDLLAEAHAMAASTPPDAIALVMVVFRRLRGWAEHVVGDAAIPDSMWLHVHERWNDVYGMVVCADKQDKFVDALLRIAATTVLKISVPTWLRLGALGEGRSVRWESGARVFEHAAEAIPVDESQALWAIEAVARATVSLEAEWPEHVLVPVTSVHDDGTGEPSDD
jgi:hypothetical protein